MDFLDSLMGGGGQQGGKGNSAAATVFNGYNSRQQTATLLPWIVGGAAVIAIAFALVLISAFRR